MTVATGGLLFGESVVRKLNNQLSRDLVGLRQNLREYLVSHAHIQTPIMDSAKQLENQLNELLRDSTRFPQLTECINAMLADDSLRPRPSTSGFFSLFRQPEDPNRDLRDLVTRAQRIMETLSSGRPTSDGASHAPSS